MVNTTGGALPVPDKPVLYQRQHNGKPGLFIVRYPTIKMNGGRTSGSIDLQTKERKEAGRRMQQWLDDKGFETAVAQDTAAHEAYVKQKSEIKATAKLNGHGPHPVPAIIATEKRTYTKRTKEASPGLKQARQQLKMLTAQLHALALNVQMIADTIGAEIEEE